MNMKTRILNAYGNEFKDKRFSNDQSPRLSGQSFGADPNKSSLSFTEFLDSYLGSDRLNETIDDFKSQDALDFELEHISNVLYDHIV